MKRIHNILVLFMLSLGLVFSSCEKMLEAEPQSALDESVIFSSPELAKGAIAGILQSFAETNSYRGRFLVYYGVNTDTEVYNSLKNVVTSIEQTRLSNYNTNVNNSQMNTDNNAWAKFYEGIERANLAIQGIRRHGDVENNTAMAHILGEILTLRAVVYNDLLKAWGDVPARFEPISAETAYLPKSDRDVIFKQLLADLEEAATLVAWPTQSTQTRSSERINKAFVKGLRARLALMAGGFAQRPDGTIRRSTDPELAPQRMYQLVKDECLEIIQSGTCQLQGFEEVFRALAEEQHIAGQEILWEIPFSEGRGRVIFDLGVRHTTADQYTGQPRGGTNGPNPLMYYEYEDGDDRRDVTCVPYEWTNGIQVPTTQGRWMFGKYRYEWLNRRVTSSNDDGLNWLYMRYSDVLLMAAEAINELDGPQAAAPYLQMVRERAFSGDQSAAAAYVRQASASKEAFFDAIVDERALEFTGEMLRKGDLIRWNLLGEKLQEAKTKLQQLEQREGRYASLPRRIYYTTAEDGESVDIYGLRFGDTDEHGATLAGYSSKEWTLTSPSEQSTYWDALFVRDPNQQHFWPIWQIFIDTSNGMLVNDYNYQ